MDDFIFSYAQDKNGRIVHVDEVENGLKCECVCPCCYEPLQARHGNVRTHGFAHSSKRRGANLEMCYQVIMYKLAEQIISDEKRLRVPSYYGIFKARDLQFSEVKIDNRYDRVDRQPVVIASSQDGEEYIIEFTFNNNVLRRERIDYKDTDCIQIDLSGQTFNTLYDFLLKSDEFRTWLNHQTYFQNIEGLYLQHNKSVKIKSIGECETCSIQNSCCGIRYKNMPVITIENNGQLYRVCKTNEYERLKKQKEEEKRQWQKERERLVKHLQEKRARQLEEEHNRQQAIEVYEESQINQPLPKDNGMEVLSNQVRTCFNCRRNLTYMPAPQGMAYCGIHKNLNVPIPTPSDTAQECRAFLLKGQ